MWLKSRNKEAAEIWLKHRGDTIFSGDSLPKVEKSKTRRLEGCELNSRTDNKTHDLGVPKEYSKLYMNPVLGCLRMP